MNPIVINNQFPSAFGRVFTTLFTGLTKVLLGVFCMTTRQIQKFTTRVKNFLPLALASLTLIAMLAMSNILVTNQVNAQVTPYMSIKWWHRTNNHTLCPDTNNDAEERCHHEETITIYGTETTRSDFFSGPGYNAAIKTDPTSGQRLEGVVRHLGHDAQKWTAQLKWFLKEDQLGNANATEVGSTDTTSVASISRHRFDSPYGYWDLWAQASTNVVALQWFYPNVNGIKNLLPGSVATLELIGRIPQRNNLVNRFSNKLFIRHNTSVLWDTASRNTSSVRDIAEQPNSNTISNEKLAKIATHESDFSNFSYKSNLYLGTNQVMSNALTQQDVDTVWTNEWAYDTTYGTWIVGTPTGTPTNCNGLKCQNVKFVPDTDALNGLTDNLKLELEIALSDNNNMVIETDTLTYLLNIPTFSIEAVATSVDEDASNAQFKVISNINPGSGSYMVKYTPTDVSGDFLKTSDNPSGVSKTESLTFMSGSDGSGGTEYFATFNVAIRDLNNLDEANGTIKVELDKVTSAVTDITFAVAKSPNNSAEVTIKDKNVPIITIDNAPNIVASQMAMFPLTSDIQPRQPLMIRYIPTETGSNFLDPTGGTSTEETMKSVPFTEQPDKSGKAVLSIPTRVDSAVSIGTLKVLLVADNSTEKTYEISGTDLSRTKTVSISAYPIRTISIEQDDVTIDEGKSVEITLVSDGDPERDDLPISYTLRHRDHDYIKDDVNGNGTGDSRTATLKFEENLTTGKWEAEITVETKDNNNNYNGDGEIELELDDPGESFYRIATAANDRKVTLFVDDLAKPLIKIRDGNAVSGFHGSGTRAGNLLHARFPLTSTHNGNVELRYRRSETANFFDPAITDENEVKTVSIGFSGGGATKNGHFDHNLDDRDDSAEGTVTVTLLEDPDNNYILSDNLAERSGSVMVSDPSYSEMNAFVVNGTATPHGTNSSRTGFIYFKDAPANYTARTTARVLDREKEKFKIYTEWYLNNSQSTSDEGSGVTPTANIIEHPTAANEKVETLYGDFQLDGTGWGGGDPHRTRGAGFILTRDKLNAIPLGSRARLVAIMEIPTEVFNRTTLHLVPNTQAYWNSFTDTKTNTITQKANTYEVGTTKEGTIITHNDPVTDLVFKSKVYDNSTTADEDTLMDEEVEPDWMGMEKTHETDYGKWIVGNLKNCGTVPQHMTQSQCYDVRFEPNLTNINQINGKIVKLDLETSVTGEADTISLIITSEGINFSLDDSNSNIIKATGSSPSVDDMDGTVTAITQSGDTFEIEVKQTTDNAGTEMTGTNGDTANMDAGFSSKVYGTDLSLGKWYFEESDASTTNIPDHTTNSIVTRNFKFIPDDSAIGTLSAGEVRYSTITVKQMRSTSPVSTESYTVSIYKADKPVFIITAVDTSVNEGESATLKVTTNTDPGANSIDVKYTPINSTYLASSVHNTSQTAGLTFELDTASSPQTWSKEFELSLRTANTIDEADGIITIKLDAPNVAIAANDKYVTDPSNVAIVEVKDATVPTITFENATAVNQGNPAQFTLTASSQPHAPLAIYFKPANTMGSFLDFANGGDDLPRTVNPKITFSGTNPITGTLEIPTILDESNESGTISVTLLADPSTGRKSYQLSANPADHTKTVTVNRNAPSRIISLDNTAITINEGETAKVKFIADDDPGRNDLAIKYTPTETSANTTYLANDSNNNGSGVSRTAILDFEEINGQWEAEVEIETNDNEMDQIHGVITVMLDMPGGNDGYTRTTTTNEQSVTINVKDLTVPTITIADANDVTPGTAASFTLTADVQPREGLTIQFTPSETGSSFLMTGTTGPSSPILFGPPSGGATTPITGTLSIPTMNDSTKLSGEISIQLMADSNASDPSYKIVGDANANTKKVRVSTNPIVEISIEERSATITEGGMQNVTFVADGNPNNSNLLIKYRPTERSMGTSYLKAENGLGTGMSRTASNLTFVEDTSVSPSIWKGTVTIMTNNDNEDGKNGLIEVVLDNPSAQDGYTIAASPNNSVLINVRDGTVPTITIANATQVEPAGIARFKLTSSHLPHRALGIKYTPEETTSTMYLNTSGGASGASRIASPKIKFTRVTATPPDSDTFEGTLSIPTVTDLNNIGTTGTISVKLQADENTTDPSYAIMGTEDDTSNNRTVQIMSNVTIPTIEIEFEQTTMNVDEGDKMIEIKVILSEDPVRTSVPIKYAPSVTGTDFLDTTLGVATTERPVTLRNFQPVPNTTKFSATFKVDTKDDNGRDEANGVITLTLSDPENGAMYTLNNTKKVLTINVKDGTVPTITIANADKIVAPGTATFTLTADPQPRQDQTLTIRVRPTETGTSFLSSAFGTSATPKDIISLSFSGQSAPYTETFDVQTVLDSNYTNGIINIEILDDLNTADPTYQISETPSENTGKVSVFSYSSIELSIEETTLTATEGDKNIQITVTATANPGISNIPVKITPTDTTGSYLESGNGVGRIEMLTFTNTSQPGSPEKWQDTFTINTRDANTTDEVHGEIEVKLETHDIGNYTISSTPNEDHVDITVYDSWKPTITIADAPQIVGSVDAEFPLTASFQPVGNTLAIKYTISEDVGNFLSSTITNPTDEQSTTITFSSSAGTLAIPTKEEDGTVPAGTISITLQEDDINYTISDTVAERTKSVIVIDHSYISVKFRTHSNENTQLSIHNSSIDRENHEIATLYIRDPMTDYTNLTTITRLRGKDEDDVRFQVKWYENGVFVNQSSKEGLDNDLVSPYGTWVVDDDLGNEANEHMTTTNVVVFEPNDDGIDAIPPSSRIMVELNKEVPTNVTNTTILHFVHNTATTWNSNSTTSITGNPNTYDVGVPKYATIKTYHSTLSDLSFKSKLYNGSRTSEDVTLSETSGEWTHTTTYGTWTIDNQRACGESILGVNDANCYDVKFEPNLTAINSIKNKVVKIDLETTISGSTTETDTLSYIIVDEDIQIAIDDNNSNIIDASTTYTASNINSTLTSTKESDDTFSVEVKETEDNAGTYSAVNSTKVGPNMVAGYSAGEYSLNLGKWYFAEADNANPVSHSDYTTVRRKITFIPDATAVNGLSAGDVRYATIAVSTMRSSNVINTETFTVAIYGATLPVFKVSAVTDSVNEGGTAQFKITTDSDPGTTTHAVTFTPTNTKGSFLKAADLNTSKSISNLTFTPDQQQNTTSWTSNTIDLELRADNSTDEDHGIISIKLDRPSGSISSATFTTDPNSVATVAVKDQSVPVISFVNAPGISAGADAVFTLTSTPPTWQDLAIQFTPTNSIGEFLDETAGDSGVVRITNPKIDFPTGDSFPSGMSSSTATLTIPTMLDDVATGEISVRILADQNTTDKSYNISQTPADNTKTVAITATFPTLELSLQESRVRVEEGGMATITVTADQDPIRSSLDISITPEDEVQNFLLTTSNADASGMPRTVTLTGFQPDGTGKYTATFPINTKTVAGDGPHGVIKVELNSGSGYTVSNTTNHDHVFIDIIDSTKPLIKIAEAPNVTGYNADDEFKAKITFSSDEVPHDNGNLTLKYRREETGTTFLDPAATSNEELTTVITFSGSSPNITGSFELGLQDDADKNSGTFTFTLLADTDNYELSTTISDFMRTITVNDPSFIKVNSFDASQVTISTAGGVTASESQEATLYIKKPTDTYTVTNTTRASEHDYTNITFRGVWSLDGSQVGTTIPPVTGQTGTITTPYGNWTLDDSWTGTGLRRSSSSKFEFSNSNFANIPSGSKAKIDINLEVSHQVTSTTTLNVIHNTTSLWDSNSEEIFNEPSSSTNIGSNKVGTIKTYHDTPSELSFKSKLYDGTTPVVTQDLTESPSGTWTFNTSYGTWKVDNQQTCPTDTDATCFDVAFEPSTTNGVVDLRAIGGKIVKFELETIITSNSTEIEKDTLTYQVIGYQTTLALNQSGSDQISANSSTTSIDNVPGTATILKAATDTVNIETKETTNDQGTNTTNGTIDQTITTIDGIQSKEYGNNLTLGSWYFEEVSGLTPVANTLDSNFHTITPRFLFKPKPSAIAALPGNAVRKSTLVVKTKSGANTIITQEISVTITITSLPILSIEVVTRIVDEGGTAQFKIISDQDTGSSTFTVDYTPTDTEGTHIDATQGGASDSSRELRDFTFTAVTLPNGGGTEYSKTIDIELRDADTTDSGPGTITVVLGPVSVSSTTTYAIASGQSNTAVVRIKDANTQPTITIGDAPEVTADTAREDGIIHASFPITATAAPYGNSLMVNYIATETSNNFLGHAAGTMQTAEVTFTGTSGTLKVPTMDDSTASSGTFQVVLQDDNLSYELGTTDPEKTGNVTVHDPSYIRVDNFSNNVSVDAKNNSVATLYIQDTPSNYTITNTTHALATDITNEDITFEASWYLNDSSSAEGSTASTTGKSGTLDTPYGDWVLDDSWTGTGPGQTTSSKFEITRAEIDAIPSGSKARIELNLEVPNSVTNSATLHLVHNTTAAWTSNETTITENSDASGIGSPKTGTIKTFHTPLSELSFVSKLYDGSSTPDEQDLTESPSGEWSYTTSYGKWVVNNQRACLTDTDAMCFDVKFEPSNSGAELQAIANKTVKFDLEAKIVSNSATVESDTISYIVNGYNTTLALDTPGSDQLNVTDSDTMLDDITGVATIYKKSADTLTIETKETTTDQGTTPTIGTIDTNVGSTAGFQSKVYGNNLTLGKWYVEEGSNVTEVMDMVDSNFHTITPKFSFKPDIDEIKMLSSTAIRKSTLTIKTVSGMDTIVTQELIVTISRGNLPIFSIEVVTNIVDEGGTAQFKIVSNRDPGTGTFTVGYTPTHTGENHIDETMGGASGTSRELRDFTFSTITLPSGGGTEYSKTFNIELRDDDSTDTGPGTITVMLGSGSVSGYIVATGADSSAVVRIKDANTPTITIGNAPNVTADTMRENDIIHASFPITASTAPVGSSLMVIYTATTPLGNFLGHATNTPTTAEVTFTGTSGILKVPTMDDSSAGSGTIQVVLQDDNLSYNLGATDPVKTGMVTVNDPSFVRVDTFPQNIVSIDPNDGEVVTLYYKDSPADYTITHKTDALATDVTNEAITFEASWYLDDSSTAEGSTATPVTGKTGSLDTPYGDWTLEDSWTGTGPERSTDAKFEITRAEIDAISVGSTAKIDLNFSVPNQVTNSATLHLVPNTTIFWNNTTDTTLAENRNTADFTTNKEATITTYHDELSEVSFELKLYQGSSTPLDVPLTAGNDIAGGWSGPGWSAQQTIYGRWVIGNLQDCETGAKCYSVRFIPNATRIDNVKDKVVRFELITKITENSTEVESDTLTYTIEGSGVNVAVDANNSSTIQSPATAITLVDVNATASLFAMASDTFTITATETTTNSATPTNMGTVSTTSNMDAGFASVQYVTDLTLGSWYFAENNTGSPIADGLDSDFRLVSRAVLFRPNPTEIAKLPVAATRTSTLTVNVVRNDTIISSNTFVVTINRINTPAFSISAPEAAVIDGGTLEFTVTADADPGTTAIDINYIVSEESGDFLAASVTKDSPLPISLPFQSVSGSNTWTAQIPIALKTADMTNATSGLIKVTLEQPADNSVYFVAKAPNNEATAIITSADLPVISIADAPVTFNGESAVFEISSNIAVATDNAITLRFKPTKTNGNFLDETDEANSADWTSGTIREMSGITFAGASAPYTTTLSIETMIDANETSGSFMVELVDDDANPQTYAVDPNKKTATVTVYRLPTLSIAPLSAEVEEGGELVFVVTADFKPRTTQETLSFKYIVSESNSNFLDPSVTKGSELDATNVVFTGTGLINWTARLPISLRARNNTDTEDGSISIALVQPSSITDFEVNTTPVSVVVKQATLPTFSIEQTSMNIDEGGTATITVTTNLIPKTNPLMVSIIPTETAGTTYLKDDDAGNGSTDSRIVSLEFMNTAQQGSPEKLEASFTIMTNADDFDMPNGVINVVLDTPPANAEYTINKDPNDRITINVKDLTVPTISIVNAPDVTALTDAKFTLTASVQPHKPLTIRFIPTNTTGNFLDVSNKPASEEERTEDITFAPPSGATTPITGTLPVPTTIDEAHNSGVITIQLLADSNTDDPSYSLVDPSPSVTVAVTNPVIPEISIANAELTFNETDARFTLTSNIATSQHTITIKPSNKSGNFFDPDGGPAVGNNRTVDVTFTESNGTYTAPLIIKTKIDNANASGEIEVELIDGSVTNSYNIVDTQKTATVQVYRVRTLEISSVIPHIIEGTNEHVFTVTSDLNPNNEPVMVTYTVTETTTDFLAGSITPGEQDPIALTFGRTDAASPWTSSITIPLRDESDGDSGKGSITVRLKPVDSIYEVVAQNQEVVVDTYDKSLIPTLNIMDASIVEGDVNTNSTLMFNVELTINPQAPLIVRYQVISYTGDAKRAIRGRDFTLSPGDVDFEPNTNLSQNISVPVIDDDLIEPVEEFHIEISVPENSLVIIGNSIGVGTINDNDQPEDPTPKPFIYIEAQNLVIEEGDSAVFMINADRPANHTSAIIGIGLSVSQGETDDFIGWRVPRQISIPENEESYQISIATVDDSVDETNGTITATITAGDGINLNREDAEATVTVNDNDETTTPTDNEPRISVADVAVNEILESIDDLLSNRTESAEAPSSILPTISVVAFTTNITEGENAEFNLISSDNLTNNLNVSFMMSQSGDFLATENRSQAQIHRLTNQARVIITTQDDQTAEGDGTITLQLIPDSTYKISSQNSATVAVSDAVDRQARKDQIASRSSEILPEVLNLVGSNALATTSQRIQQAQGSSGLGASYRINGAQDLKQIITTSGEMINSEPESLRSILGNSEFAFDVYSEDNLTNPVSVWGLGELKNVNSTSGASGWTGDAFTGHLGFDTKLSPNTLMGMTTSIIDMDAGFALKQNNEFILQSRNTTFNPYLNWTSQNNDAQLQTIVGYGFGAIDIKQPNYQYETLQSFSSAISVNGRKQLYASDSLLTGGTSTLSLVGESWITQLQVAEKQDIIDATNLSAQHHRIAVDGSHNITLDNGSSIKPTLSIGLLHDGKNQDALQGLELRNGLTYSNTIGFGLAGNARLILEPSSQARLWNLNGSLDFDYGRDQLGAILNITGTYSHGQENYTDLLNMSILDGVGSNTMDKAINTELQYGLKVCGNICQVTPYAGYNYNLDKANSAQFGTRFSVGTLLNLEYEGSYNPSSDTTTNQKVQLNSRISW